MIRLLSRSLSLPIALSTFAASPWKWLSGGGGFRLTGKAHESLAPGWQVPLSSVCPPASHHLFPPVWKALFADIMETPGKSASCTAPFRAVHAGDSLWSMWLSINRDGSLRTLRGTSLRTKMERAETLLPFLAGEGSSECPGRGA